MKDGYNGILTDFYDIDALVKKVNMVLDNRNDFNELTVNARKTIVDNYDIKDLLPKEVEFFKSIAK